MMLQSFLIFLPSLIGGFFLIHALWESQNAWTFGIKFFLGVGIGLGITSCLYFFRILLFHGQGGYILIQIIFLVIALSVFFLQKRTTLKVLINSSSFNRTAMLFGLAVAFTGVITLYYLVTMVRAAPHGDYDAQAIWNLRARFIYRLGDSWENAFSPLINRNFHMDYPLLIPLNIVGGWNTLGGEVLRVPSVLSMLFLFGMAGVMYFFISYLRSSSQAAIAVILLLATPSLLLFSTFQTADIPLAYFFLGAACLLILARKENNRGLLFLAGLMAGLSAWTKNEGIPFVLIMVMCTILIFGVQQARTRIPSLLAGMALPLFTIVLFKTIISVNNDLFTNNALSEIILKLFSLTRYVQILTHLISELSRLGDWPVSIIIVLFVYAWILGRRSSNSVAEKALWILPSLQFLIYMLIYVITPHDLEWHLNYSMSRLLIHLFPLALCSYFLSVNTPEFILTRAKQLPE